MNTSVNGFYSGSPPQSDTRQINDPQYLKTNIFSQELKGQNYVYFLAEKLNNSEIKYNDRFFMLTGNLSFGYASKFKIRPIPFMDPNLLFQLKRNVKIEDITFTNDTDPVIMNVKYFDNASSKTIVWKVRFANEKMCGLTLEKLLNAKKQRIQDINNPKPDGKQGAVAGNQLPSILDVVDEKDEKEENEREEKERKEKEARKTEEQRLAQEELARKADFALDGKGGPSDSQLNPEQVAAQNLIRIQSKQKLKESLLLKSQSQLQQSSELKIPHYKYNYEFLKQGEEYKPSAEFKEEAKNLVRKIIDELCLFSSRRTYRPVETLSEGVYVYEVGGLVVKIGYCSSVIDKETRVRKYKLGGVGSIYEEFKNHDYLLQTTRNKGPVRVPLACLVEYKGFACLVKAQIPSKPVDSNIKKHLQSIAVHSRIDPSIFQDLDNVQIVQLDQAHYEQFSKAEKQQTSSHFYRSLSQIYYFSEIKHFLPKDIKYISDDLSNKLLRPEFINRSEYENVLFIGQDLEKLKKMYEEDVLKQELKALTSASKDLQSVAKEVTDYLSSLEFIPLSSFDLEKAFHDRGLNMRYIWLVYQSTPIAFIRKLCHTYACVKTIATLIHCKFQELILQWMEISPFKNQTDEQIKQSNFILKETAAIFLNTLLGSDYINDSIRMLNSHMIELYGITYLKTDISPGFLVQGLNEQVGLTIQWPNKNPKGYIFKESVLSTNDIFRIDPKVRVYSLRYTSLYQQIQELIEQKEVDNIERLQNLIHLKLNGISTHIRQSQLYNPLLQYLSAFIKPSLLNSHLRASSVYGPADEMWNYSTFQVRISEIKWLLLESTEEKAFVCINKLINELKRKCEDNHPVESEVYTLLSQFYFEKGDLKQSEKYGLSALKTLDLLVNPTHIKKADIFYQLSEIYLKNSNYFEALKYMNLVKHIIESKMDKNENGQYPQLLIKIASTHMKLNQNEEAISTIKNSIQIYEESLMGQEHEDNYVEALDIICRLYDVTRSYQESMHMSEYCSKKLPEVENPQNYVKLLKMVVLPLLSSAQKPTAMKLIYLIQCINQEHELDDGDCLKYLRFFTQQSDLFDTLQTYIEHLDQLYVYISNQNLIREWNGLGDNEMEGDIPEFLCFLTSIVGVTGLHYMLGALSQAGSPRQ